MESKLQHPVLFVLVGLPSSGKTYLARQLARKLKITHIGEQQIRANLFGNVALKQPENRLLRKVCLLLIEECLKLKTSVICDIAANSNAQRAELYKLAKLYKYKSITIYQQVDKQVAWLRAQSRRAHRIDDQHALALDKNTFNIFTARLEPPAKGEIIVISGIHTFNAQAQVILRRLLELQFLKAAGKHPEIIPKPGMVNLINVRRSIRQRPSVLPIILNKDKST